jgi:two-component system sensor kinase FixL
MLKVMIAEDDPMMADMLEDVLVKGGYEVCGIARTVEKGVELGERHEPDLAVLDLGLAEGGLGTEIASRLNRKGQLGVLYATGNVGHTSLTKADGEACLGKPYRPEDVVRALQIVSEIVITGEASTPFPPGFYVLRPTPSDRVEDSRLAAIVESSDDAIIAKDLNGIVFAWNKAAEQLFGYTASEMIGQPLAVIFPPDRLDDEAFILNQIALGERVEQYETTRRCKDGQVIRVSATVSPIRDTFGRITGASKILRNLTDRDARERRIQELQAELAHVQRLTELGQVLSTLVHEMNQPITAIQNYLNAYRRLAATGSSEGLQKVFERIEDQTKRTSEIVRRIRDFVKKREIQMHTANLPHVIEEAIALTRASLGGDGPTITVQMDPTEPRAEIDKVQVQQVLFNLMRNGIEAMVNQPTCELMVTTKKALGGMIEISVADTGSGLSDDVRCRLFEPFVTTKPDGMGVGLSVCHGIVQQHGGRLWADDNIGGGTVFRFTVRRPALDHLP